MYGTVCSNILSMVPLPNINRAYATIIQEERHRNTARSSDDRGYMVGFTVETVTQMSVAAMRSKEKQGTCTHCGKNGHDTKLCYQIIGYPKW